MAKKQTVSDQNRSGQNPPTHVSFINKYRPALRNENSNENPDTKRRGSHGKTCRTQGIH